MAACSRRRGRHRRLVRTPPGSPRTIGTRRRPGRTARRRRPPTPGGLPGRRRPPARSDAVRAGVRPLRARPRVDVAWRRAARATDRAAASRTVSQRCREVMVGADTPSYDRHQIVEGTDRGRTQERPVPLEQLERKVAHVAASRHDEQRVPRRALAPPVEQEAQLAGIGRPDHQRDGRPPPSRRRAPRPPQLP